jgi:hypothetical protein
VWDQATVNVAAGVQTIITDTTPTIVVKQTGKFKIDADTSGANQASMAGGTLLLNMTVNGGAPIAIKIVLLEGVAGENGSTSISTITAGGLVPGDVVKFELLADPTAGGYNTLIHEGAIVAVELG